jgi:hypothetical protein
MKKSNNYLLLSAFFFAGYLIIEFTEIFGSPTTFKAFLLIACVTFLISGVSLKQKERKK